jgi:hypothetical protein
LRQMRSLLTALLLAHAAAGLQLGINIDPM